ncbi:MAG TPA: MBL fold metallo-hydrolase [Thermoanaerobaculia bacterium]|nr:MBL fold metallo-hydrolase [Thermoanaerobaculia bacterium]
MQIEVLGSSGGETPECRLTSLLINDTLALDAGCLTRALSIERQASIEAVLLTHSHIDHLQSLPFFIENVYHLKDRPFEIWASAATIDAVRRHMFNNAVWPDFSRLPSEVLPALRFHELEAGRPVELAGLKATPFPVSHPVPTFGFLFEQEGTGVIWSSDTGPTEELWRIANRTPGLAAVCLDTSFANELQGVADLSMHLTPRTLDRELDKLTAEVPVLLHHLKPLCRESILAEVAALGRSGLDYLEQGRTYHFGR